MVIKVIIRKVCNLIQWQFRRRNYDNEFKINSKINDKIIPEKIAYRIRNHLKL